MTPVPNLEYSDVVFGCVKHLPRLETIPDEFKRWRGNVHADAISHWFHVGAENGDPGIIINHVRFVSREGVDSGKALNAIKAIMACFEPSHEHKVAGAAFLLSEWFEVA